MDFKRTHKANHTQQFLSEKDSFSGFLSSNSTCRGTGTMQRYFQLILLPHNTNFEMNKLQRKPSKIILQGPPPGATPGGHPQNETGRSKPDSDRSRIRPLPLSLPPFHRPFASSAGQRHRLLRISTATCSTPCSCLTHARWRSRSPKLRGHRPAP